MLTEKLKASMLRDLDRIGPMPSETMRAILEHGTHSFDVIYDAIVHDSLTPRQVVQGIYVMREYAKLSLDLRIKLLATVLDAALAEDETLRSYAAATAVQMAVAADKAGWIAAQIDISRIPETIHTAYQKGINIVHRECVERYLKNIGLLKM